MKQIEIFSEDGEYGQINRLQNTVNAFCEKHDPISIHVVDGRTSLTQGRLYIIVVYETSQDNYPKLQRIVKTIAKYEHDNCSLWEKLLAENPKDIPFALNVELKRVTSLIQNQLYTSSHSGM